VAPPPPPPPGGRGGGRGGGAKRQKTPAPVLEWVPNTFCDIMKLKHSSVMRFWSYKSTLWEYTQLVLSRMILLVTTGNVKMYCSLQCDP
jgi:hypothetical protein